MFIQTVLFETFQRRMRGHERSHIFYITMIRPVLEYASPVWHSSLTKKLCDKIESQQIRALRIIVGNFSYSQILTLVELPFLHERREILGKKFVNNIIKPDNCLYHLTPST